MKYRKKPVVIEAWQFDTERFAEMPLWVSVYWFAGECLHIPTLEGVMRANEGDWIIRGVKGELYPCKPDIFAATYEPVEERE